MHTGVVRNDYDHTGIYASIREREQRVGGNIQSDMLHAAERTRSGYSGAACGLHSDFFVRCPFAVYLIIFSRALRHLGARGAGIARCNTASGFVKASCDGLVS